MNNIIASLLTSFPNITISDNSVQKQYKILKDLTRSGDELHARLSYGDDNTIYMEFTSDGNAIHMPLSSEVFPNIIHYMLSGRTDFPKDLGLQNNMLTQDDLYEHIKIAYDRNMAELNEMSDTEVHVKASYPYGSMDYGTLPLSKADLITKLVSIKVFPTLYREADIPDLHSAELPSEDREIEKGQTLSDIFPDGIPADTIVDKTVCGLGATHLEIHSARPSIIIEPNIPVIEGKKKAHSHIIAVYGEDIKQKAIKEQIQSCTGHVKIMTTPDSYGKVIKAVEEITPDYHYRYFLLFDECEKIVSDIDYRPNMSLPIDDFFMFKDKAMVSATPIIINDPRFKEQDFKVIKIRPKYGCAYDLELKPTNNVNAMVRRTTDKIDGNDTVCFFYNSVNGIKEIIDMLGISDKSNIYCSTEAKKSLKRERYQVYDTVTEELNRYNFFTSRFYSAVDIKVNIKPTVIMITQVYRKSGNEVPYSFIDPETEAIQIAGRFRNGIKRLIHITNTDSSIVYMTKDEAEETLNGWHNGHMKLKSIYDSTQEENEKYYIRQAIMRTDYFRDGYADFNGSINYFRYNNAYIDHRLELLYRYPAPLNKSYRKSGMFNVTSKAEYAIYTDEERMKLEAAYTPKAERIRIIHDILSRSTDGDNEYDKAFIEELKKDFPLYADALSTIGLSEVKRLNYNDDAVRQAVRMYKLSLPETRESVYREFTENTFYTVSEIRNVFAGIFQEQGISFDSQIHGEDMKLYFNAVPDRRHRGRGVLVMERLSRDKI